MKHFSKIRNKLIFTSIELDHSPVGRVLLGLNFALEKFAVFEDPDLTGGGHENDAFVPDGLTSLKRYI